MSLRIVEMASPICSLAVVAAAEVRRPAMRPIFSSSFSTAPRCFWMAVMLGAKSDLRYWNMLPRENFGLRLGAHRRRTNLAMMGLVPRGRRAGNARSLLPACGERKACDPTDSELNHRNRRQRVNIGHYIDHDRPVGRERLGERRRKRRRLFDPNAERAHIPCNAREIDLAECP